MNQVRPDRMTRLQMKAVLDRCVDVAAAMRIGLADNGNAHDAAKALHSFGMDDKTACCILDALLHGKRTTAGRPNNARPKSDWRIRLLDRIIPSDLKPLYAPEDAIGRLVNCIMAIPDWTDYADLVEAWSGERPNAIRRGRDGDSIVPADGHDIKQAAEGAVLFLSLPSRVEYIAHGATDLSIEFDESEISTLNDMRVYVMDDACRLEDHEILNIQVPNHEKLGFISKLYSVRRQALAQRPCSEAYVEG